MFHALSFNTEANGVVMLRIPVCMLQAQEQNLPFKWQVTDENLAAGLCYTSGTTGNPKVPLLCCSVHIFFPSASIVLLDPFGGFVSALLQDLRDLFCMWLQS